jgi:hypothetical protein
MESEISIKPHSEADFDLPKNLSQMSLPPRGGGANLNFFHHLLSVFCLSFLFLTAKHHPRFFAADLCSGGPSSPESFEFFSFQFSVFSLSFCLVFFFF